jgi:DNA-binding Lrp family transcriptional regulator
MDSIFIGVGRYRSNRIQNMALETDLDEIDRRILGFLQKNARISNKTLAAWVGLAQSSCLARVRRLETSGVIRTYAADLDPKPLGLDLQALISVRLASHATSAFGAIGCHLRDLPEARNVYCLGGAVDFLVHVVCRNSEHLRVLTLEAFTSRPEIERIETSLVFAYSRGQVPTELSATPVPPPRRPSPRARRTPPPRRAATRRRSATP